MTKITMRALDTMHMSNVQADNLLAGDRFDVSEADAKILEDRKLAVRVSRAKAEAAAPETKMEAAPQNKAISSASVSAKPARKGK